MKAKKIKWNAQKIKDLMADRGMNQMAISKKIDESPQVVSYYLNHAPTVYTGSQIARALSTKENPVNWRDLII